MNEHLKPRHRHLWYVSWFAAFAFFPLEEIVWKVQYIHSVIVNMKHNLFYDWRAYEHTDALKRWRLGRRPFSKDSSRPFRENNQMCTYYGMEGITALLFCRSESFHRNRKNAEVILTEQEVGSHLLDLQQSLRVQQQTVGGVWSVCSSSAVQRSVEQALFTQSVPPSCFNRKFSFTKSLQLLSVFTAEEETDDAGVNVTVIDF